MHSSRILLPALLGTLAAACSTYHPAADFAQNELFYVDVPFETKAPGDRPVWVAPVVDARTPETLPTSERGFPIRYGGDEFWDRPVTTMLGEVLGRGFGSSHLFPAVQERASAEALLVKPTLLAFTLGSTEAVAGSRSFAEIALRIQVLGPAGADGKRGLLHEQVYGHRVASEVGFKPVSPYLLVAPVLQTTMQKLLRGLDGSNVARSAVPIDLDGLGDRPAEATSSRR